MSDLNNICYCGHLAIDHQGLVGGYRGSCKHCPCAKFSTIITKENSEPKPRIPEFIELLEASKAIHLKKNADYANENNPFSNFERSAELISWFQNASDKSFIALIGTKLTRIAELRDGRIPNNESLDDSFLDLLTYVGLWGSYVKRQSNKM